MTMANPTVKLGILFSQTGPMAVTENAHIQGVLIACDEINSNGGIDGRPLELVIANPAGDDQRYDELAKHLLLRERVSAEGSAIESSSGIAVETRSINELRPGDAQTILVAGAERDPLLAAVGNPALRAALPVLAESAERFGSVCTGGFLLAALGLLDGRRIATHWDSCKPLAATFPAVTVDPDALYVVDGPLWTSAGVTTGIDMALAMIANDLDAAIAGEVAKRLILYARRPGYQSQFSPVLQAQVKGDSPFADLIGWIQTNLDAPLDVPTLADRAGLSERTFHRRFVAATGLTPARFVETARLDAARLLLSRGLSLKSVAAQVGLFPATRLSEAFERRFGVAPRLFREMHAEL